MIGMSLSFKDLLATDDVALKPETLVRIPRFGEIFDLSK